MKLTLFGQSEIIKIILSGILVFAFALFVGVYVNQVVASVLAVVTIVFVVALLAFFRDPERVIPKQENVFIAPADGVIRDIVTLTDCDECAYFDNKPVVRIGIFLSVLDVHINRAPCHIEVEKRIYKKGKYHDARNLLASKENEAMSLFCSASVGDKTFPLLVRQISGAIARRIVCVAEPGSTFKKGEQFGMIKFGSRTELFLPENESIEVNVHVGDKVFAGETIVARVNCN